MRKDDWIWVAIRVFGIYLFVRAILLIPSIAAFLYWFLFVPESAGQSLKITATFSELKKGVIPTVLVKHILGVICYFLFGLYFVRGGRIVHGLISNFPSEDDEKREATTSYKDTEEEASDSSGHSE